MAGDSIFKDGDRTGSGLVDSHDHSLGAWGPQGNKIHVSFHGYFFTKTSSSLDQLFVGKNTSAILPIEETQISEKHGQGKHTLSAFYLVLLKT